MSLRGKKILVTRPAQQSRKLLELLHAEGAEAIELPLIRICAPDSWDEFDLAFKSLNQYSWIIFASTNAVETSLARAGELGLQDQVSTVKIACVGASTAAALAEHGLKISLLPQEYIADSLLKEFPGPIDESSRKLLWPRTNIGRNTLKEGLEKKGWTVEIVHSYQTLGPEEPEASAKKLLSLLESRQVYAITLASSETCKRLKEILDLARLFNNGTQDELLSSVKLAAIGPETANSCLKHLGRVDLVATEYTSAGLIEALRSSDSH